MPQVVLVRIHELQRSRSKIARFRVPKLCVLLSLVRIQRLLLDSKRNHDQGYGHQRRRL